jgi:hypothetical protein
MSSPRLELKQKNQENVRVPYPETALSMTRKYYMPSCICGVSHLCFTVLILTAVGGTHIYGKQRHNYALKQSFNRQVPVPCSLNRPLICLQLVTICLIYQLYITCTV